MQSSHFLVIDFKAIDHDQITRLDLSVNPLDKVLKVGSIKFFSMGETSLDFIGIEQPFEAYRKIKEIIAESKANKTFN